MTIIDAHAHFWKYPDQVDPSMPGHGDPPITPEEILQTMDEAGVDKLLQITRTIQGHDNSYSLEGAARHSDRIRVLGRFHPLEPDMPGRLREWLKQPYIVGVRLWWPDIDLRDPDFEPFWTESERLDIPISLYGPGQATTIGQIGRRHPGLRLIADHLALPVFVGVTAPFATWKEVLNLVDVPNVWIKVSGLPEITHERYPFPQAREYMRQIYERFGADRLMWGSNYPPTLRVCSYKEAVDLIREVCDFLPSHDRAKLLGSTAEHVFRLSWEPAPPK